MAMAMGMPHPSSGRAAHDVAAAPGFGLRALGLRATVPPFGSRVPAPTDSLAVAPGHPVLGRQPGALAGLLGGGGPGGWAGGALGGGLGGAGGAAGGAGGGPGAAGAQGGLG
jgi:hypothetical protein